MKTIRRTRQQLVDPWDMPPEREEVSVIEEEDNITEEVEYTLEQLKHAYNLTEEERGKIWIDHGSKNEG